jgi:hypothetical protein
MSRFNSRKPSKVMKTCETKMATKTHQCQKILAIEKSNHITVQNHKKKTEKPTLFKGNQLTTAKH